MLIYSKKQVQVRALKFNKVPTAVLTEYSNYSNVFSAEYTAKFLKHIEINNHAIEIKESKQPSFGPIYSLRPVELEILKTYIKTNLANCFI